MKKRIKTLPSKSTSLSKLFLVMVYLEMNSASPRCSNFSMCSCHIPVRRMSRRFCFLSSWFIATRNIFLFFAADNFFTSKRSSSSIERSKEDMAIATTRVLLCSVTSKEMSTMVFSERCVGLRTSVSRSPGASVHVRHFLISQNCVGCTYAMLSMDKCTHVCAKYFDKPLSNSQINVVQQLMSL